MVNINRRGFFGATLGALWASTLRPVYRALWASTLRPVYRDPVLPGYTDDVLRYLEEKMKDTPQSLREAADRMTKLLAEDIYRDAGVLSGLHFESTANGYDDFWCRETVEPKYFTVSNTLERGGGDR